MTQTLEANARDAARDVAITRRLATVAGLIGFVLSVLLAIPAVVALSLSEPLLLMFHEPPTMNTPSTMPCMPETWKSRMTASAMLSARRVSFQ